MIDNAAKRRTRRLENAQRGDDDASPVRPDLAGRMHVELVVNENAQVWVLHDKPFPAILQWAEYDEESNALTFITHDGKIQDLGMVLPDPVADILLDAGELCAILMQGGEIRDMGFIPVMVREIVFH